MQAQQAAHGVSGLFQDCEEPAHSVRGLYTAPMTDPATPDELAPLYLRDRDVPCPGCGYNRRGGTSAACPECGHHLRLQPVIEHPLTLSSKACYTLGIVMILYAALLVPVSVIDMYRMGVFPAQLLEAWVIQNIAVSAGFLTASVFAVQAIIRTRASRVGAARSVTRSVAAILAGFSVPILMMLIDLF